MGLLMSRRRGSHLTEAQAKKIQAIDVKLAAAKEVTKKDAIAKRALRAEKAKVLAEAHEAAAKAVPTREAQKQKHDKQIAAKLTKKAPAAKKADKKPAKKTSKKVTKKETETKPAL